MAVGAGCRAQCDAADQLRRREIQLDRGERGWAPACGDRGQSHGYPLERSDSGSRGRRERREALLIALGPRADAALWTGCAFLRIVAGRRGWSVAISERRSTRDMERSHRSTAGAGRSLRRWPPGRVCFTAERESTSARGNERGDG